MVNTCNDLSARAGREPSCRRRLLCVLLLCLAHLSSAGARAATTHDVDIFDFYFEPSNLVIAPGDTVVWHAHASDHTVTADDGSFDSSPASGDLVTIPDGSTFSHTFPTIGSFHYYCRLHGIPESGLAGTSSAVKPRSSPTDVMTGRIRVVDPTSNSLPQTPLNSTPGNGATGLSPSPLLQATVFSDPDPDDHHAASQWLIRLVSTGETILDTGTDPANLTSLRLADLEAAETYEWQVRYSDDRGGWSAYSAATRFTVTADAGSGSGLAGTYFAYNAAKDLITKQVGTRIDPVIDFDWALNKPHPSAPANGFFIYWEGTIVAPYSEEYQLRVKADGGVRIWIDGQLVIDDSAVTTFELYRFGSVTLEAGIPVPIRIQYYDTVGAASMHLRWSSPSLPLEVIPQARLFPTL
jgi:plastocyanin